MMNEKAHLVTNAFYQSLLEIVGEETASKIFNSAHIDLHPVGAPRQLAASARQIEKAGAALASEFSPMAARGLLIRAGRASLIFFRRFFGEIDDLGSLENRLKPVPKRFLHSLDVLGSLWAREMDQPVTVRQCEGQEYLLGLDLSSLAGGGERFTPYFLFGLLEEFCQWLDARKKYRLVYSPHSENAQAEIALSIASQE
jgi:hypothetical protein